MSGLLAIVGAYRGVDLTARLIESLAGTSGIDRYVIVDDSGKRDVSAALRRFGNVIETGGSGYNVAMQRVCEVGATEPHAVFLEEDFTITKSVDWTALAHHLDTHPQLAQVVLQRQAWYARELRYGFFGALERKGHRFSLVDGFIEHRAFFSCNPAVWRRETFTSGWPTGDWSESSKGMSLAADGYRFAITPDIQCHHDGIRTGYGY